MQKTTFIKSLSLILCIVLIAAMALFTTGCNDNNKTDEPSVTTTAEPTTQASTEAPTEAPTEAEKEVRGEGAVVFDLVVVEKDGKETKFEIHTDKKTVGEALTELKIIDGEVGEYGLMVTSVNGVVADFNVDKTYWAFYIDGEYASVGVDSAPVQAGSTYMFKVEK